MRNLNQSETLKIEQAEIRLQKFMREFERTVGTTYRKLLSDLKAKKRSASEVANMLGRLNAELEKAVLGPGLAQLDAIYAKELKRVKEYFAEFGYKNVLTDADARFAETLINFDASAVKTRTFANADSLKSAVMRSVTVGNYAVFDDLFQKRIDGTVGSVETELRTGLSGFHQAVKNNAAAEVDIELFAYLGPDDDITRPFCQDIIERGRVFTFDEIKAMNNEQGLPVEIYGGGYNCRHEWAPISEEMAKEEFGYEP